MTGTIFGYKARLQVQLHNPTSGPHWVDVPNGLKLDLDRSEVVVDTAAILDAIVPPCECCGTKLGEKRTRR